MGRRSLAALTVAVAMAVAAPAAEAKVSIGFKRIAGVRSAGTPAKYDKVGILRIGPRKAKNILVLNPGTSAGSAYFVPLAKSLVSRLHGWQVWSVERRENLLEDQSRLNLGKAGKATPKQVFDYYVGWLGDSSVKTHLRLLSNSDVAFARRWGMRTEIGDLRRVVRRARKGGRRVVLGGHSLGGTITTAYATWDFGGRPGARGLSGLVFIDGASRTAPITDTAARSGLDQLATGSPWLNFGGLPTPFAGLLVSLGGGGVLQAPNEPSLAQDTSILPPSLKPPVPSTNEAQFGYALDSRTSPASLAAAQAHLGRLAASGNPRGWDGRGALTPIVRFAEMFSGGRMRNLDGSAWYHPQRLTLDAGAVANGNRNVTQRTLGVRAVFGHHLPRRMRMYAFGAALGGKRVLASTRALARQSHIPRRRLRLVDRSKTYSHNDPNSAAPGRNAFLKGLIPFLRRIGRG